MRIFITGSADGLGLEAARQLLAQGHEVVLHARNQERANDALQALGVQVPVAIGDVATLAGMKQSAEQANQYAPYTAVIHNVGVGENEEKQITEDGIEHIFAVNVLAPYVLTAMVARPQRLIYLSSGLHANGDAMHLDDIAWEKSEWSGAQAYADSKLYDTALAMAVGRLWPEVYSNAVDPGWVPTKMGGEGAPDSLQDGAATQVWLATDSDPLVAVSGNYFHHRQEQTAHPAASSQAFQDGLLRRCAELSGVELPR